MPPFTGFVGPSYALDNVNADAQTCMNWYPEKVESGDGNAKMILELTPGLKKFADLSVSLGIAKSHTGNFTQGQTNATFEIIVSNPGIVPTSGTVIVEDTLPSGLTLVSMAGTGWTYIGNNQVMRSDVLAPSASYPPITVTVNVAANASSPQVNSAAITGGGLLDAQVSKDSVTIDGSSIEPTLVKSVALVGGALGPGNLGFGMGPFEVGDVLIASLSFTPKAFSGSMTVIGISNGGLPIATMSVQNHQTTAGTEEWVLVGVITQADAVGANINVGTTTALGNTVACSCLFVNVRGCSASPVDDCQVTTAGTGTAQSSPNVNTTGPNRLIVGFISDVNAGGTGAITFTSSNTIVRQGNQDSGAGKHSSGGIILSADAPTAGAYATSATSNISASFNTATIALK